MRVRVHVILIGWTLETKEWVCLVWISADYSSLSQTNERVNTPPEFPVLRGLHIGVFFLFKCSRKQGFLTWLIPNFAYRTVLKWRFLAPLPPDVSVAMAGQVRDLYFSPASGDSDRQSGLEKPHL